MKTWVWIVLLLIPCSVAAQSWKTKPFSVSLLNNATLLPPKSVIAPFNQPLHPGVSLGYEFGWKETVRNPMFQNRNTYILGGKEVTTGKIFQDISLAYYYHRYVNHAFALTTHGGYRKYIRKFTAEISLHMGYLHSQLLTDRLVRRDGMWVKGFNPARGYFIAGAGVGLGYDAGYRFNVRRFFVNYDFRLQMPFVKNYVPVLPNGIVYVGLQFTLFRKATDRGKAAPARLDCPKSE
jgi:hypothetical protein